MRVKISKKSLGYISCRMPKIKFLADQLDISERTIRGWFLGEYSMPLSCYEKILEITGIQNKLIEITMIEDFAHNKEAGRKGALVRMKKYGNFGTPEGRKKGGVMSCMIQGKQKTNFKTLKNVHMPRSSDKLAELMGILFGDGHLSDYQVSVTTGLKTDHEHANYIQSLIKNLFKLSATKRIIASRNTIIIYVSSKKMVDYLSQKGMPIGNKINKEIAIPLWIKKKQTLSKAFIRGLFDTDGCIYIDKHIHNDKTYRHLGWAITSHAPNIISDTTELLRNFGYSPTHTPRQKSIFIRKQKEINRYFNEIKSNNSKHILKYNNFYGRVPKWS